MVCGTGRMITYHFTRGRHPFRRPRTGGLRVKGISKWFLGPRGFLDVWGTEANKPRMFVKLICFWPCRRRRQDQQTMLFLKMSGFCGFGTPDVQNNTWPKNHVGILLGEGHAECRSFGGYRGASGECWIELVFISTSLFGFGLCRGGNGQKASKGLGAS